MKGGLVGLVLFKLGAFVVGFVLVGALIMAAFIGVLGPAKGAQAGATVSNTFWTSVGAFVGLAQPGADSLQKGVALTRPGGTSNAPAKKAPAKKAPACKPSKPVPGCI